ncbi:NodT family efflux transporter outer membrane factor (OMF) lipoprotein [Sphingomonas vulcanisoli]|uniref:NodT family efflux transporter outer membrane factor (OMF) lipoprotein n=1 Tax=Sphingomonas vulcanisoli TaxID=1658060 RepID=A0ABX0TTF3_9SPHN|nr:TolC family protein [Sphingomonas vulcanisoli]NIJ07775.1 NodT family efflux transporter outer membrane factor (OMF) lipoprotein [Sphingomonas vulcanisoli]
MKRLIALSAALLLGGCMVGPNYKHPAPTPAATGPFVEPQKSAADLPAHWWRLYDDPTLDALITEALANNTDVRVAAANLKKARYVLAEAHGKLLPTTTPSASYTRVRQGTAALGATGNIAAAGTGATAGLPDAYTYNSYSAGFDVNYELDLFGGVRRGIEAARGDYGAAEAALDAARVAVAADTARAYGDSCGYAAQVADARETMTLEAKTVDLTERLNAGGGGTMRDVDQARTVYEQAAASLANLEAERRATLDALAVLTGKPPAALDPIVATCTAPPKLSAPLPNGDGRALLARRPDVRRAERQLAADTARVGVATADLYPTITLAGSVSLGATRFSDIGKARSLSYSLGPLISWNFPIQSEARARVRQARAQAESSLASFDGAVLTALKETEQALARLDGQAKQNAALGRAYASAADAYKLSQYRFDAGADNFLQLLDAERTRAQASAALAQSNSALIDAEIDLFRALGGGWEDAPAVNEKPLKGNATH